ncbi:ribosomal protein L7/L12 [Clostridium estertheticum]|nr:ribosomal protein L7/L12 [Clostridium estertheticum]
MSLFVLLRNVKVRFMQFVLFFFAKTSTISINGYGYRIYRAVKFNFKFTYGVEGKRIKAIKRYREVTGLGLVKAKEYVDLLSETELK